MTRWLPLAAFAVLAVALFWGLFREDRDSLRSVFLDKPAPAFSLPSLEDPERRITEADFVGDGPVVLNFWATWCPPCIVEHPKLLELAQLPDLRVIGINYEEEQGRTPADAIKFLERRGDPFTLIASDVERSAKIDYGIAGLPETFVIAPDGTILYKHVGPINPGDLENRLLPAIEAARDR